LNFTSQIVPDQPKREKQMDQGSEHISARSRHLQGLRKAGKDLSRALFKGSKLAFDYAHPGDVPTFSFESLGQPHNRFYPYLLTALTQTGTIGCSTRDLPRAWRCLSTRDFLLKTRSVRQGYGKILLSTTREGTGILHINTNYYSAGPAEHRIVAPYFAHPAFYKHKMHTSVFQMRGEPRSIRVFFSGTLSRSAYSEKFHFPILSRDKVLTHVLSTFGDRIATRRDARSKPIVMLITSDISDILEKHALSLPDYMDTMARSAFFICPPGTLMPHSHNMVEAMSVGAIPITNYHSYVTPPLTPDVNCLAFSTLKELEEVIERALRMSEAEIRKMRLAVIDYYDRHLDPKSFGKTLRDSGPALEEVVVIDEIDYFQTQPPAGDAP
jgi:hypothetical protein